MLIESKSWRKNQTTTRLQEEPAAADSAGLAAAGSDWAVAAGSGLEAAADSAAA